jgi:amino acid transporter
MNKGVKGLSIFAVVMLISGSIDSIRNLPTTALFGTALVFFFVVSAIVFLIPAGLVSAELSSNKKLPVGVYGWVKTAFGKKIALLAIWLQWINTMVWYPTILSFIAGTIAFLIDPALAQNKYYLIGTILTIFWFMTFISLRGTYASARFASICAVIGMVIPMFLIIGLGLLWAFTGNPLAIHFTSSDWIPTLSHGDSWISLTAIMTAFLGMELAAVHVNDVKNPQKNFPRALMYSVMFILMTMILGALAIAFVIPHNEIHLVDGIMQAFSAFLTMYHLQSLLPVLVVMLVIGSVGGMTNWIISPAKGLLQAGEDGYLPKALCKINKHGVASRVLLIQAGLVSFVCLAFLLMPSVNGSYWLLTDLSTQLYMLMYVLMFLAAVCIKFKVKDEDAAFKIPGGKIGMSITCALGLIGCIATLIVGFIPPSSINVGGAAHYETMFVGGLLIMLLPTVLFYWYHRRQTRC